MTLDMVEILFLKGLTVTLRCIKTLVQLKTPKLENAPGIKTSVAIFSGNTSQERLRTLLKDRIEYGKERGHIRTENPQLPRGNIWSAVPFALLYTVLWLKSGCSGAAAPIGDKVLQNRETCRTSVCRFISPYIHLFVRFIRSLDSPTSPRAYKVINSNRSDTPRRVHMLVKAACCSSEMESMPRRVDLKASLGGGDF